MKPAANIVVKVLLPDGSPAANAAIYVGDNRNSIFLTDALPQEVKGPTSQRSAPRLSTSSDGTFTLTPQLGVFELVAVHDRGIGSAIGDPIHPPATIQLAAWSKVHGVVADSLRTKQPQQIQAFMQLSFALYQQSNTLAADGSFTFNHVPPGHMSVSIPVEFQRARSWITLPDHLNVLEITPGQAVETKIGGAGAIVTGKIALPPSVKGNLANYFVYGQLTLPPAPRFTTRPTTAEMKAFRDRQLQAKSFAVRINDDGTFSVNDIPPGKYALHVYVAELNEGPSWGSGPAVAQLDKLVQVGLTPDRCDLGDLFLEPPPSPKR